MTTKKPGSDNTESMDELEQRLAEYGQVLRNEISTPSSTRRVGETRPGNRLASVALAEVHELGVGNDSNRRRRSARSLISVAAACVLIAGLVVGSLRPSAPSLEVDVAASDSTRAPASAAPLVPDADAEERVDELMQELLDSGLDEADMRRQYTEFYRPEMERLLGTEPPDSSLFDATPDSAIEFSMTLPTQSSADAVTVDPVIYTCAEGVLVDDQCRIVGDPPVAGDPSCPVGDGVLLDSNGCYRVLSPDDDCGNLDVQDDDNCREIVDKEPTAATCPAGFSLRTSDNACVQTVDASTTCDEGVLTDGLCRVVGEAPVRGEPYCAVGGDVFLQGDTCVKRETPSCTGDGNLGLTPDGQSCKTASPTTVTFDCAIHGSLARLNADSMCEANTGPSANDECEAGGEMTGFTCWYYKPATGGESCRTTPPYFEEGGSCWMTIPTYADGTCPNGEVGTPNCVVPVDPDVSPLTCDAPWYPIGNPDGGPDRCGRDAPAQGVCDDGSVVEAGTCLQILGAPTQILTCDVSGALVPTEADCWTASTPTCSTADCVVLAELRPGPMTCADGFTLQGECFKLVEANVTCSVGTLDDNGTTCVEIREPSPGEPTCPAGEEIVEVDGDCFRLIDRRSCGDLSPLGDGCRSPVELVPGESTCDQTFGRVGDECLRWENAVPSE